MSSLMWAVCDVISIGAQFDQDRRSTYISTQQAGLFFAGHNPLESLINASLPSRAGGSIVLQDFWRKP